MKPSGRTSLGFRLIAASIGVAAMAVLVTGLVVYNLSLDSVKKRQLEMVRELARVLSSEVAAGANEDQMRSLVTSFKTNEVGATWLMTRDGVLVASPEAVHSGYLGNRGGFPELEAKLLAAETARGRWTRRPGETHVLKFRDIGSRYISAFGEYRIDGQKRVVAVAAVPGTDLMVGVDEPVKTAYSHHREILKYVAITCVAVAVLISAFTWIALKKIIRPYYRELEDKSNEVAASNVLLSSVSGQLHSDRIFSTLAESMSAQFNVDSIEAFSYDPSSRLIRFFGDPGGAGYGMTVLLTQGGGLVADCVRLGRTLRRRIDGNYAVLEGVDEDAGGAYEAVAIPIVSGDEVLGAIVVDNRSTGRSLGPDRVEAIGHVLRIVASVIAKARAHERLHRRAETLAVTDTLTGLYAQTYLLSRLREELAHLPAAAEPLSVLLCEVMGFREINANYGVKFGNDVLMAVAAAMKSVARLDDVASRFGGALFAVILPHTSSRAAATWGEHLKLKFSEHNPGNAVDGLDMELSIGIMTTNDGDVSEDELLDRLLDALADAQREGKGGIVVRTDGAKGGSVADGG